MKISGMVIQFMEVTGQEPDPILYEKLIEEEYEEFWLEAVPEKELKELADLVYVCFGYAVARGWNLEKALQIVHDNNLKRVVQGDGAILRREDGKIIKNPNHTKPDLKPAMTLEEKITMVDPPSGWMFGFPAPLQKDYKDQLKEAGYPPEDIDFAIKHSRYWEE
jgi:predicted house-cleaning noncanonical NTP pyrophosphatase (MazG superfamily)